MGSVSQVRMKPGCVPTKFECQPDRRKRTSSTIDRPYILKKQRKMLVEECEKDFEESSNTRKDMELGETSYGHSVFHVNIENISEEEVTKSANKSIQGMEEG
ncbi:unnamed protein product, partial [Iphiclides podalirius]